MKVEDIDKDLDALLKRIKDLDKYLIDIGAPHKDINIDVYDIKRKAIRLEFEIDYFDFSSDLKPGSSGKSGFPIQRRKLNKIKNYINLITDYNDLILQHKQKKSLDVIALLSLIFVPLGLITGYFGMNFEGFGGPAVSNKIKKGILTIKYPHIFAFSTFIISALIMILLYFHFNNDSKPDTDQDSKN